MIIKTTAIPLVYHPYSNSSRVVHWLTRSQGKVAVLLKGALRPKSPFLGEYELFSTSELLYYQKRSGTLCIGKECAMLHMRNRFRTDWRAMQAASYISFLFDASTPEDSPQPGLFEFYEQLLDFAVEYGSRSQFLTWAELQLSNYHGHAPNLENCIFCHAKTRLRFCSAQGGTVCADCSRTRQLPTHESPPDVLAILRAWQKAAHPQTVVKTHLSKQQIAAIDAIVGTFLMYHFNIHPKHRTAVMVAA